MTRRYLHEPRFRGVRAGLVTVTCRCGWVSQNHRSRGEAFRAHQGHVWLAGNPRFARPFGVDARRGRL